MKFILLTFFCCTASVFIYSQNPALAKDSQAVFTLGEVVVRSEKATDFNSNIGASRLQQFAKKDVSKALNLLPGINLSSVFVLFFPIPRKTLQKPSVKMTGEVTKPLTLNADDLAKMKRVNANLKDRQGKDHNYTGDDLQEILGLAGVTMGNQLRGENLTKYLLVKSADGYQVIFTLAELDSSFTDRKVILAYESDGKPLPAGMGPFRVVVPGEKKPARSSFQVNEFMIKFAKE